MCSTEEADVEGNREHWQPPLRCWVLADAMSLNKPSLHGRARALSVPPKIASAIKRQLPMIDFSDG